MVSAGPFLSRLKSCNPAQSDASCGKSQGVSLRAATAQDLTFVEDYLKTKTGIIIPIGSTMVRADGLIGTDALTADDDGRGAGERRAPRGRPFPSVWRSIIWVSPAR
jgi:hypothetical protein